MFGRTARLQRQQRERQADEQAMLACLPRLRRYARALTGARESADDLVQDTLERAWQKLDSWQRGSDMRPWLFAIIRHQTIDGMRRQKSYRKMLESQTQDHTCAEDQIQAAEDASLLEGCLFKALKPQHREALTLTKIIGLSCKEAAVQLGVTEVTLKVRVHRAIKQLKKLLEAEPYE